MDRSNVQIEKDCAKLPAKGWTGLVSALGYKDMPIFFPIQILGSLLLFFFTEIL